MASQLRTSYKGPAGSAQAAGLRYVSAAAPGIVRQRNGRGFRYRHPDGRAVRAFSNRYATEVSAACLGPDQVVISAPASSRIQTIP